MSSGDAGNMQLQMIANSPEIGSPNGEGVGGVANGTAMTNGGPMSNGQGVGSGPQEEELMSGGRDSIKRN